MNVQYLCLVCGGFAMGMLATAGIAKLFAPIGKAAAPRFDKSGVALLEYHWSWRQLCAVMACDPLCFLPFGIYGRLGVGGWIAFASVIALMSGVSVVFFVEANWVCVTVDDNGILTKSPWHRDCFIRWDEITGVTWKFMNGLEVRSGDRRMIVPQQVQGMAYLLDMVRLRVSPDLRRYVGTWVLAH